MCTKMKLNAEELIKHMKSKGITFDLIDDDLDPVEFLSKHNYYYKFAAYRHNFNKRPDQTYIGLDFKHLQELSTIDMHLRHIIFKMCLDIEHSLKIKLLNHIENNSNEDGYSIVSNYIEVKDSSQYGYDGKYRDNLNRRTRHKNGSYNKNIISKYANRDIPIWVFVELITFNELIHIIDIYQKQNNDEKHIIFNNKILNNVRDLRNATAHNNCLIYNLKSTNNFYSEPSAQVHAFIQNIIPKEEFSISKINTKLKNTIVFDICCLLYTFDKIVSSKPIKHNKYEELDTLINDRCTRNSEIFKDLEPLNSVYRFFKIIVDNLKSMC